MEEVDENLDKYFSYQNHDLETFSIKLILNTWPKEPMFTSSPTWFSSQFSKLEIDKNSIKWPG